MMRGAGPALVLSVLRLVGRDLRGGQAEGEVLSC